MPIEARQLRKTAGLTQRQVADVVGVAGATVCRWESGLRFPRGENAVQYLAALDRIATALRRSDPETQTPPPP